MLSLCMLSVIVYDGAAEQNLWKMYNLSWILVFFDFKFQGSRFKEILLLRFSKAFILPQEWEWRWKGVRLIKPQKSIWKTPDYKHRRSIGASRFSFHVLCNGCCALVSWTGFYVLIVWRAWVFSVRVCFLSNCCVSMATILPFIISCIKKILIRTDHNNKHEFAKKNPNFFFWNYNHDWQKKMFWGYLLCEIQINQSECREFMDAKHFTFDLIISTDKRYVCRLATAQKSWLSLVPSIHRSVCQLFRILQLIAVHFYPLCVCVWSFTLFFHGCHF